MSRSSLLYNVFFKKTSTFVVTCAVGAFIFERLVDTTALAYYDSYNRGRQWKDIKHKYE